MNVKIVALMDNDKERNKKYKPNIQSGKGLCGCTEDLLVYAYRYIEIFS